MKEEINNIKNEAIAQIMGATSLAELGAIEIAYLGRSGKLSLAIKKIKEVPVGERKEVGLLINAAKNAISLSLATSKSSLSVSARKWFDPTVPGDRPSEGHLHLVTKAIREISRIFENMGYVRVRYPEVEWDWFAFGALNMPQDHPARDEWETFFLDTAAHPKFGSMVLTPHTSSGQIREMARVKSSLPAGRQAPIRMINIAKCFRRQADISHVPMFHQFEGLLIDRDISIANLKGTLDFFARTFFGPERKTRLRPFHFQFTEPSFEVDISCGVCQGQGCKLCKAGWLELGGAGMVHPAVLTNCELNPAKYSGFAFGWGVERTFMMKAGIKIPDIRLLYSSDLRVLRQF